MTTLTNEHIRSLIEADQRNLIILQNRGGDIQKELQSISVSLVETRARIDAYTALVSDEPKSLAAVKKPSTTAVEMGGKPKNA